MGRYDDRTCWRQFSGISDCQFSHRVRNLQKLVVSMSSCWHATVMHSKKIATLNPTGRGSEDNTIQKRIAHAASRFINVAR